jgi:chemotaxis protein methyltransferase CheR
MPSHLPPKPKNEAAAILEIARIAGSLTGIQLNERHTDMIKSRLQRRYLDLGLQSISEYVEYYQANQASEKPKFVALLTTHHTFFFREFSHFEFLTAKAIPELLPQLKARRSKKLRIWSAACSRGQEAYSLAMYLDYHLKKFDPSIQFEILGTDVDAESVEVAKNGVYLRNELKEAPLSLVSNHWAKGTGEIANYVKAKNSLKDRCTFRQLNLLDLKPGTEPTSPFDLIFCRNVFIYFNESQIRQITSQLLQRLAKTGYFFVGTSESLTHLAFPISARGAAVYQHTITADAKSAAVAAPQATTPVQVKAAPLRVFCVDDSASIQILLKKILDESHGFEVVGSASNGQEATQKIAELRPDVVTLDIHMPVMTGIEYLEKSFKPGHPPVVMITSVSREDAALAGKALQLGASDFVEKPVLSNLDERADEIRAKLRCAVSASLSGTAVSMKLDQSFQTRRKIEEVDGKLRVVVMSLSHRGKLRTLFSEFVGAQPPMVILVEGAKEALDVTAPLLSKEAGTAIIHAEAFPRSGQIVLMDFKTHADAVFGKFSRGKSTSILVYGEVSKQACEKIILCKGAQIVLEDLGGAKGTSGLMRAASDVVPATSFGYLSNEFFSATPVRKTA